MNFRFFANFLHKSVTLQIDIEYFLAHLAVRILLQVIGHPLLNYLQILHRYNPVRIKTVLNLPAQLYYSHKRNLLPQQFRNVNRIYKLITVLDDDHWRLPQKNSEDRHLSDQTAGCRLLRFQFGTEDVVTEHGIVFVYLQSVSVLLSLLLVEIRQPPVDIVLYSPRKEEIFLHYQSEISQPLCITTKIQARVASLILTPPNLMVDNLVLKWAGSENIGKFLVSPSRSNSLHLWFF